MFILLDIISTNLQLVLHHLKGSAEFLLLFVSFYTMLVMTRNFEFLWQNFGFDKIQKTLGSQLCIASLVVIALSVSHNVVQPVSSR